MQPSKVNPKINYHHHHKHQGLEQFDPFLLQSYNCSRQRFLDFQFFSFLVVCSAMISTGFGFEPFFAIVNVISVCFKK